MRIDEMVPYERNAWDNSEGIPAIAESIKAYGFRGRIKLWKRDNPIIISGHHRVAACRSLGWEELDDEHIEWCEDMTEEEVMAFRLADNRTGQSGKWNRALTREEVRRLAGKGVDMSRFGFDFKSKLKQHGAERLRTDGHYNLEMTNATHCSGRYDMPALKPVDFAPKELLPFNYAKTSDSYDRTLHFFIDDYQFERLWNQPEKYLELIKSFEAVLTPDFSLYPDMPLPMQQWNEYRRRALGSYWQRNGVKVIPTLSWRDERSYGFCFEGLPKRSTVAVSTVGAKNDESTLGVWQAGMDSAMRKLRPARILLYGGNIGYDFGKAEVIEYKANTAFGGRDGR